LVISASIFHRRITDKPIFPSKPDNATFYARGVSGRNLRNFFTRLGGAQNCLAIAVTAKYLQVTPTFPFNLGFLPDVYGLEANIPRERITAVERKKNWLGQKLTVRWDGGAFEIRTKEIDALERALIGT
jgi:hypothetical protein